MKTYKIQFKVNLFSEILINISISQITHKNKTVFDLWALNFEANRKYH
jgi:hypothetical protein